MVDNKVDRRANILSVIIKEFSHQINPVKVIEKLEAEDRGEYAYVVRTLFVDDLKLLIEVMGRVKKPLRMDRPRAIDKRKKPSLQELVTWRDYVAQSLYDMLSLSPSDPNVRRILSRLRWDTHGELVGKAFPDIFYYRELRARYYAPWTDPDPFIIGCHGYRCKGKGGLTRQMIALIIGGK